MTTSITSTFVADSSTAALLAFFNAHTGGAAVKRFADRANAERRVNALIAEMVEDGDLTVEAPATKAPKAKKVSAATLAAESAADDREIAAWNSGAATPEAPEGEDLLPALDPADLGWSMLQRAEAAQRNADKKASKKAAYVRGTCPACGATADQTAAGVVDGTNACDNRSFCHHCSTEYWNDNGKVFNAPATSEQRRAAIAASWCDDEIRAARSVRRHVSADGIEYKSLKQAFMALGLALSNHIKIRGQLFAAGKLSYAGHMFKVVSDAE